MFSAAQDDRAYRALGHHDRRRLLRLIGERDTPVGELAVAAEMPQPIVSQHLRVLRDAGLVTVRAEGNRRLYSVDAARLAALRRFLDDFWTTKLDALTSTAETVEPAGEVR